MWKGRISGNNCKSMNNKNKTKKINKVLVFIKKKEGVLAKMKV